jgi:uncharacterized protein
MKIRQLVCCICLLAAVPVFADDAPPTEQSIQQLLELTNVRQLLDQIKLQFDSMMSAAIRDAQQGQTLTPERQAVVDRMKAKMSAVMKETLNWDTMMPLYVRTYRASLTQDELDGMIAFYQSPPGQAYIKKMPVIMQNVMVEMQAMIKPMQQKMVEIQKETLQELKNLPPADSAAQGGSTS